VQKTYKYYVVSRRYKSVKMCNNLLLFLFIWGISKCVSESYYFRWVRATRNIMHVMFHIRFGPVPIIILRIFSDLVRF